MTLYSYIVPVDDGAAPNPFFGACTLVICKPRIRRVAKVGDWVVATGSKNAPGKRDLSGKVVYLMRVSLVMTMREYDSTRTRSESSRGRSRTSRATTGAAASGTASTTSPAVG